jgi:hypothetical protein
LLVGTIVLPAASTLATDVPVVGTKLIVVDKLASAFKAKAVFVSKDPAITKGAGTDPFQISAQLDVAYDSASGAFDMPPFDDAPTEPWDLNAATVAKYVWAIAPTERSVKLGLIKPGMVLKVVAKGLGDHPIDLSTPPSGPVYASMRVANGGEWFRHCTQFADCVHQSIAAGTGYKLVCRGNAVGDAGCVAARPSCFTDTGQTVLDACRDLQWEQKETTVGSGVDAGNLHDVDNLYQWAGACTGPNPDLSDNARCQPNAPAAATCMAQTGGANGCAECPVADGPCQIAPGAVTTVWDWLNQLNAVNFAGHGDWWLPTAGSPREMESILDYGFTPRIDPTFGPTAAGLYWSALVSGYGPYQGDFSTGRMVQSFDATTPAYVRAVR